MKIIEIRIEVPDNFDEKNIKIKIKDKKPIKKQIIENTGITHGPKKIKKHNRINTIHAVDEAIINEVRILYELNSAKQVAKILNIPYSDVRYILNKYKIRKCMSLSKRDKIIKDLFEKGKSNKEIAEELGLSIGYIYSRKSKIFGFHKNKIEERNKKIKDLIEKGKSNKEIAEELGLSITNTYRIIKRDFDDLRNSIKNKQIEESNKKIKDLVEKGKSNKDIAKELGLSESSICRKIKKLFGSLRNSIKNSKIEERVV